MFLHFTINTKNRQMRFSIDYISLPECTVCMQIKFDIIYWVSNVEYPSVYRDVR